MNSSNLVLTKLARITKISKEKPKEIFTSIYHLLNKDLLLICHKELKGNKAIGLDGMSKMEYEQNLMENIEQLEYELQNMKYKPSPSKRVYIPKANRKRRSLSIANYEDKLVQMAIKKLIEAIFEPKFTNNMFGFRPNRNCHSALKKLNYIIEEKKVNYVVDADIKGFFDHVDHKWLIKCLEQHIKDERLLRMVKRFLKAGIIEENKFIEINEGTAQGSILSPILANIYMYYVLDLWFEKIIKRKFTGESYITIYADDFVCCFQYKIEAIQFMNYILPNRLKKFNLEISKEKTRMIRFGKYAKSNSKNGKVETFDFLGFTHYCSKSRKGKFRIKRRTSSKKFKNSVKEFKQWIIEHRHYKISYIMKEINVKLVGYYRYYGITDNMRYLVKFKYCIENLLFKWLNRRSQRRSYNWEEFKEMLKQFPLIDGKIYVNIYEI